MIPTTLLYLFFFFNDTATTEIYTLSLHDALPISLTRSGFFLRHSRSQASTNSGFRSRHFFWLDRKSTRLNSSHQIISYAVFCLKKKTTILLLHLEVKPLITLPTVIYLSCALISGH